MGINGSYVMRTLPRCSKNIKNESATGEFGMPMFRSGGSKRDGVFRVSSGLAAAIPGGIELRYAVAILNFFLKTRLRTIPSLSPNGCSGRPAPRLQKQDVGSSALNLNNDQFVPVERHCAFPFPQ
jgi:hypothetical protein